MILKLGTSLNSFRLIPNVSSLEYTNKNIPHWNEELETYEEYRQRVSSPCTHDCYRRIHGFETFRETPIFPEFDPDLDKSIIEYHRDTKEEYRVRELTFIVNNTHMVVYTPYVCYVCNDDGKTLETLR